MIGFNAFDPADYFLDPEPLTGTAWDSWRNGDNSAIDAELAEINFLQLADAIIFFVEGTTIIEVPSDPETKFESYVDLWLEIRKNLEQDKYELAQTRFIQEFSRFMQEILALLSDEHLLVPFDFESRAETSPILSANWRCTHAAYAILCMDRGMVGLLKGLATDAARGFTYAQISLTMWSMIFVGVSRMNQA